MTPFMVGLGAALVTLGMLRWRDSVRAALVLAVLEGVLRKWIFPDYGVLIYLAKDLLLLGGYLGFLLPRLVRRERFLFHHPASVPLVLFGILAAVGFANPSQPSLGVWLLGVKAYLIYVPLLYVVPVAFRDILEVRRFLIGFAVFAIVPMTLGMIQFWTQPGEVLNRYAWGEEFGADVAVFGEGNRARITGTFSFISGHVTYMTLIVLVAVALMAGIRGWRRRLSIGTVLALAVANLFMTGSRGPFMTLSVGIPAVLALAGVSLRGLSLVRTAATGLLVLSTVALVVNLFPDAVGAFRERVEANDDVPDRLRALVSAPLWALGEAGLSGYGIGTTHQAVMFLGKGISDDEPPRAEGEWEQIILEVGPIGFVLVLVVRLFVIMRAWQAWRTEPKGEGRAIFAAALVFVLLCLAGNVVFNHVAGIFYWFMAGVALVRQSSPPKFRAVPGLHRELVGMHRGTPQV
ncbi:MAG: O-antigen ligase family protein [Candidatus Entotheonellia bacterium]